MDKLHDAYEQTDYIIFADSKTFCIRPNKFNNDLNAFLEEKKINTWAILTAYNPKSVLKPDSENNKRQQVLINTVEQHGFSYILGENPPTDTWPVEKTIFIQNISLEEACKLGNKFKQNALLFGTIHTLPAVIWV